MHWVIHTGDFIHDFAAGCEIYSGCGFLLKKFGAGSLDYSQSLQ